MHHQLLPSLTSSANSGQEDPRYPPAQVASSHPSHSQRRRPAANQHHTTHAERQLARRPELCCRGQQHGPSDTTPALACHAHTGPARLAINHFNRPPTTLQHAHQPRLISISAPVNLNIGFSTLERPKRQRCGGTSPRCRYRTSAACSGCAASCTARTWKVVPHTWQARPRCPPTPHVPRDLTGYMATLP